MIYKENESKENKSLKIEELYEKITKTPINSNKKYLIFYLITTTEEGIEVKMPKVKYICHFHNN